MIINADNPTVAQKYQELEKLMVENGAWFHENLTLNISGRDMQMEMSGPVQPKIFILKVPTKTMVPFEAANITVQNGALHCEPDTDKVSSVQSEILALLIEIFNLTDKLSTYETECAFKKYKENPELLELLLNSKNETDQIKIKKDFLYGKAEALSEEDFACWSFFQSRLITRPDEAGNRITYLMPIVDCLNHDCRAHPFGFKDNVLHIKNAQPVAGSKQCFAFYGHYDTLDLFLSYGFVDITIPFSLSIPMEVELSTSHKLRIDNYGVRRAEQEVSQQLEDLKEILPSLVVETKDEKFSISHLLVPALIMPHSMRRVLHAIIQTITVDALSPQMMLEEVYLVEKQVIEKNIAHYQDVLEKIEAIDAPQDLKDEIMIVAEAQLNKLYKYPYQENPARP